MIKRFIFLGVLFIFSCTNDVEEPFDCEAENPTYNAHIRSIIITNCTDSNCHDANAPSDIKPLTNYTETKNYALDPSNSFLSSIKHLSGFQPMPDGEPMLEENDILRIECWIGNQCPE